MKVSIAYGIPASGKSTLLQKLEGIYHDYDTPTKILEIKSLIKSLKEGIHNIDFMLFNPNDFINYFFNIHPNAILHIYRITIDKKDAIRRDLKRERKKLSNNLINKMVLQDIIPRNNLKVIEVTQ